MSLDATSSRTQVGKLSTWTSAASQSPSADSASASQRYGLGRSGASALGAVPQREWTVQRVVGAPLTALAARWDGRIVGR